MAVKYIDGAVGSSGDGSWGSPWKNLSDANGVSADDTVYVRGAHDAFNGEYVVGNSDDNRFIPSNSGGDGTEITLMNYNDEEVWVVGSSQMTGWVLHSGNIYKITSYPYSEPTADGFYINWRTLEEVGGIPTGAGEYYYDSGGDIFYAWGWNNEDLTDEVTNDCRYSLKGRYVDTGTEDYIIIDGINFGAFGGDKSQCIYTEGGGSNRTIRNLSVMGGRGTTAGAHGIHIKGDDDVIDNCVVMYCGAYGFASTSNDGNGIHLETQLAGTYGQDCIIRNCRVAYCDHCGIRVDDEGSNGGMDVNTLITGNYVSNCMGSGLQCSDVTNVTIEFNVLDSNGEHTLEPRSNMALGSSGGDTHNLIFTIRYNIISNGGSDSQVGSGRGIDMGFEGGTIYDIKIYNNTFYESRYYAINMPNYPRSSTTFEIAGNIFYNNNTVEAGSGECQIMIGSSTPTITNADYNIFYSASAGSDYWYYKGDWRTLGEMWGSYSLEENSDTIVADPFVDAANLDFRLVSPQSEVIDIMSTHPISGWDASPGSYPITGNWKWDELDIDYDALSGQSTKHNNAFDAGASEYIGEIMAWKKLMNDGDPITDLTGTAYRLLLIDSAGDVTELAHGTINQVLTSGGASVDPTWEDAAAAGAHDLGGAEHNSDTLANLNTKVSDATLDDSSDTRTPSDDSVGAAQVDEAATDIAFAQVILTPAASGSGTTEGTVYYSSADDHLYVYVTA